MPNETPQAPETDPPVEMHSPAFKNAAKQVLKSAIVNGDEEKIAHCAELPDVVLDTYDELLKEGKGQEAQFLRNRFHDLITKNR
jgi:hypothetical protein